MPGGTSSDDSVVLLLAGVQDHCRAPRQFCRSPPKVQGSGVQPARAEWSHQVLQETAGWREYHRLSVLRCSVRGPFLNVDVFCRLQQMIGFIYYLCRNVYSRAHYCTLCALLTCTNTTWSTGLYTGLGFACLRYHLLSTRTTLPSSICAIQQLSKPGGRCHGCFAKARQRLIR